MSDISSIGSSQASNATSGADGDIKLQMGVNLMKAAQDNQKIVGSLIEDTVSISKEAMAAYKADKGI